MSFLDWKVGDRVVCIEPRDDPKPPNPIFNEVYTISWIGVCDGTVNVDLVELPCPDSDEYYRGYHARIFRKVPPRKTDISVFTALLHTTRVPSKAKETT